MSVCTSTLLTMADVFTFDCNQLNFFKISAVVVEEFPIALRRVFTYMWNNLACHLPGFQPWDDSLNVRMIFLNWEGGTTKVPCNKSFKEWDCTALFQATLFAKCFGVLSSSGTYHTIHEAYVKPCGLTRGTFHPSVLSPTGNQKETFALSLDQLRLMRNILSHQTSTRCIDRATFDDYMRMVKDAFTALGQATSGVEDIKNLEEKDFPTERSRQLEKELTAALQDDQRECCKDAPASCVPDAIPHFIGRKEECDTILRHLTAEETRLVNAWGPPGFGKTSVATRVARELHEMRRLVYFIPAKGMTTKDELVSKLLSIFAEACKQVPHIAPSDKLIQSLRRLPNPSVLILDNVDGLVESRESKVREDMLRFTEDVLHQCNAVKLLYTTRESMDYLSHKVAIHLQKIGVLDEVSSISLVKSMLPGSPSEVHCCTVAETCGRVPLAMRLMCSIVKDEMISVEDLLKELESSPLVNVLDNPRLPNDARLKALINSSFQRLTEDERRAFVCLAVFPGCFKEQAATLVLESESALRTKRIIHMLERKSLIESSENFESFTIHSLLQSFIDEKRKNDKKIDDLFRAARARFYQFYIAVFQSANRKFLSGRSFEALKEFIAARENIVSSLLGCVDVKALFYDAVTVLSEAELFLYAVLKNERDLFEKIYTKAMRETQERQDCRCECQLRAAKAFAQVGWFLSKSSMVEDSLLADKTDGVGFSPPKQMCYIGFYCLLAGKHEEGMKSLTRAVEGLGSRCDEVALKVLACHALAVCYRNKKNEKMASNFKSLSVRECLSRESPFALRFLFTNSGQDLNSAIEDDFILAHLMAELQSSIYTECANYNEIQDLTYGLERFHRTLIALTEKVRGEHVDTAQVYYELGLAKYDLGDLRASLEFHKKALSIRQQLLGDDHTDTAASYDQMGCVYLKMGDHRSAIESFKRALELNIKKRGDHVDTAQTYHHLGVAKCDFGDLTGSIASLRQALNLRRKLLGDHTDTAVSYDQLGCVYRRVGNLHAASDAFHSAANMRTKLLGDHIDAAESFFDLGLTRFRIEDYQGALEAHEQAARLRQQLLRDHPDTAASFEHLGLTYYALGDKESSLQSLLCALDIRTKLLNAFRSTQYADDNDWWVNKYRDALASQQETLKMTLEWSGQQSHIAVELIETGLAYLDTGEMEAAQEAFQHAWTEARLLLSIDEEPSNNCTIKKLQHCCLL